MQINLHQDETVTECTQPYDGCTFVVTDIACPECREPAPIKVRGQGIRETTHDTYVADAMCLVCSHRIGTLRVTVSTIFGIEEDERMLNGRARVY